MRRKVAILRVPPYLIYILGKLVVKLCEIISKYFFLGPQKHRQQLPTPLAKVKFEATRHLGIQVKKEHILAIFTAILGVAQKLPNPYSYSLLNEIGCKSGKIMSNYLFLGFQKHRRQLLTPLAKVWFEGETPKKCPKIGF